MSVRPAKSRSRDRWWSSVSVVGRAACGDVTARCDCPQRTNIDHSDALDGGRRDGRAGDRVKSAGRRQRSGTDSRRDDSAAAAADRRRRAVGCVGAADDVDEHCTSTEDTCSGVRLHGSARVRRRRSPAMSRTDSSGTPVQRRSSTSPQRCRASSPRAASADAGSWRGAGSGDSGAASSRPSDGDGDEPLRPPSSRCSRTRRTGTPRSRDDRPAS